MKILTAEQMRNIDRRATERFGIPSIVLMENAAVAVVDALAAHYPDADRVAVLCGPGQNGGDGFAIARHLENRGVVPVVVIIGDRARYSGDALINLQICERLGLPIYDIREIDEVDEALVHASDADVVIDAIFGTGLNRAPEGIFADVIRAISELRLPVISVDLPSGANASSSQPFEPCIQAEYTVTFAAPKHCHVFEPAAAYCGEVAVADIAIPEIAIEDEGVELALVTPRDIQPFVMPRFATAHKGTYGHVGIVAGSPGRSGAAAMTARAAIRSGAGLVTVISDSATAAIVHASSAESMTFATSIDDTTAILASLEGKSAVVIGPGLRDDEESYTHVRELISHITHPLVIDASALNAFAGRLGEINPGGRPRVITPHPGELARISGTSSQKIAEDRIGAVRAAAKACRCIVVLKGYQTLIAEPDGHVWVNLTGNPGMASGGMGDVLSGMIGAFLARNLDPIDAATVAVYLHGLAGDMLREQMGDTGLAASDLAEKIPYAIQRVRA